MNHEIIKNLDNNLLKELYINTSRNLTYQRTYWLNNEKSRTEHLKSLILETREELDFVIDVLKIKGLKWCLTKDKVLIEYQDGVTDYVAIIDITNYELKEE